MTQTVELPFGQVRYRDSGGMGPTVVFIHGLFVDSRLWGPVTDALGNGYRCVAPDLPLGAHELPSRTGVVTPQITARLVGDFLAALDLVNVTLVATDTGGAITQLLLADGCDRVTRVVLTPCDSFDNFLPRQLRPLQYLGRIPGALHLGAQSMRVGWLRRFAFRSVAKRDLDSKLTSSWIRPLLTRAGVRRDTVAFLNAIDHRDTRRAAQQLRTLRSPVLLLWPRKLPLFPFEHARRWQRILPDAQLVEVSDSYAFVCSDQPKFAAGQIARFIDRHPNRAMTAQDGGAA